MKSKNKETAKQHVVPRVYLRRFAEESDTGHYRIGIRMIDQKTQKVKLFSNAIENIGFVKNFYDTVEREDSKYWEHYFANYIEPLYGNTITNVIARATLSAEKSEVITIEEKEKLAYVIVSQMLRVPTFINHQYSKFPQWFSDFKMQMLKDIEDWPDEYKDLLKNYQPTEDWLKDT